MVGKQIRASDVDRSIISLQIFRDQKLCKRKFIVTGESLKLVRIYQIKYIRRWKTIHMKVSHRRYNRLWHVCLPMQKDLE